MALKRVKHTVHLEERLALLEERHERLVVTVRELVSLTTQDVLGRLSCAAGAYLDDLQAKTKAGKPAKGGRLRK